ncbi:HTH domain-containing protein [Streptomyces sp. NPDC000349]|uniref:helix-turn-helix transcriptional regulator n=1 Tax=unclassified Streptomyces TaxID=2593676 RepID=UPI0027872ADD|nr:HTH domain-containing protein [Streptomyces sp. DSM 40167]MDQ0403964.1 putative DNA-binding transcriptional regulator YafY [Streptomyces sp. DSM 40167]
MSRPQRLIELLAALQTHPRTTAEALAEELGVSTRTVLRDVRALVDAGIPSSPSGASTAVSACCPATRWTWPS